MILSHTQIEEITAAVIKGFNKFCFRKHAAFETYYAQAAPIDLLAGDYLGLRVSFAHLSDDGSICGLMACSDTEYTAVCRGIAHTILLKANTETYSSRIAYSLRGLKTLEDWNEWQADVLRAAFLMPQREIDRAMHYLARGRRFIDYEGYGDLTVLKQLCRAICVSRRAAVIRLRQMGCVEGRIYAECTDPLEVWA